MAEKKKNVVKELKDLGFSSKSVKNLVVLKDYSKKLLELCKKEVMAMWVINPEQISGGKELALAVLMDDMPAESLAMDRVVGEMTKLEKNIREKEGLIIRTINYKLSDYYRRVMQSDIDLFAEIKQSVIIHDSGGFVAPLRNLIIDGKIIGTAESMTRRILDMKKRVKKLYSLKTDIMEDIYFAVVSSGQAALIAAEHPVPIHKEVSSELEKTFLDKGKIGKSHIEHCARVVNLFKQFERGEKPELGGKVMDTLIKETEDYLFRMSHLINNIEDGQKS